jgi:hypothetical protein
MKQILFYLAISAWAFTLIIHILTFAEIDLAQYFPFFLLFIGVFIVWIPAVFTLRKNKSLQEYQSSHLLNRLNPVGFQNILFKDTPFWLKCIAIGSFVYGFINFFIFFNAVGGTTGIQDGQYVLQNHGEIFKVLTKQEYNHYGALETRGMSGHILVFYGVAAAILYPFNQQEKTMSS